MDGKWLALGAVGGLAALSTRKRGSSAIRKENPIGEKPVAPWPFLHTSRFNKFTWVPIPGFRYDLEIATGKHGESVWYFSPGAPLKFNKFRGAFSRDAGVQVGRPRKSIRTLDSDVADFDPRSWPAKWDWALIAVQHFSDHRPEEFRRWASGHARHRLYIEMPKLAKRVLGPEKKGSSARRKKPDAPWPFFQTRKFNEFTWGPADQIRYDLDVASDPRSSVNLAYFAPGARTGTWLFPPGPSIRKLGQDVGDFDPRSWAAKWDWALIAVQHFSDHHPEEFRRWASGHARHRLYIELPKLAKRVLGPEKKGSSSYKVYSIRHHGPVTVWGDEEWRNPDFQSGDYALWWDSWAVGEGFKDAESITEVEGNVVREYTCLAGYVDEPNFEPETPDWAVQEIYLSDDDLHDGKGGVRDSVGWMASIGVELIQERGGGDQYEVPHDEVMAMDPSPQQALPLGQKKKGSPSLDWISLTPGAVVRRAQAETSHGTYEWDPVELRYFPSGVTRPGTFFWGVDRSAGSPLIELWGGKRWKRLKSYEEHTRFQEEEGGGVPVSLEDAKRIANEHHMKRRGIRSLRKK